MPIELEQKYVVVSERPWTVQAELLALLRRAGYGVELQGEKVACGRKGGITSSR